MVTADHGQVNVPAEHRFDLDADPRLRAGVGRRRRRGPGALPAHRPGAETTCIAAWREVLGDAARVVSREEAVADGWFGPVPEEHLQRIGDVVATCTGTTSCSPPRPIRRRSAKLIAFHGSATAAEMMIPLLVVRG